MALEDKFRFINIERLYTEIKELAKDDSNGKIDFSNPAIKKKDEYKRENMLFVPNYCYIQDIIFNRKRVGELNLEKGILKIQGSRFSFKDNNEFTDYERLYFLIKKNIKLENKIIKPQEFNDVYFVVDDSLWIYRTENKAVFNMFLHFLESKSMKSFVK